MIKTFLLFSGILLRPLPAARITKLHKSVSEARDRELTGKGKLLISYF